MLGTWVPVMKLTKVRCSTAWLWLPHSHCYYHALQTASTTNEQLLFPDRNKPLDHKDNITYLYRDLVYCEVNCTLILYCWLFLTCHSHYQGLR